MDKQKAKNELLRAMKLCTLAGFQIVVASDPEGNNWHTINPMDMFYDNEQDKIIALGVWEYKDEEEVFNN